MKARRSAWRATLALALVSVLAAEFVLATPAGGMAFRTGGMAFRTGAMAPGATSMSEAGPSGAHHPEGPADPGFAPAADGDPGPMPMPCGDEGGCGWGLMQCDGVDSCAPLQAVPADRTPSRGTSASPTATRSSMNKPASASPEIDRPPPRT